MTKIKPNPLEAQLEFIEKARRKKEEEYRDQERLRKQFKYPPVKDKRDLTDELDICKEWIKQLSKDKKKEIKNGK